MADWVTASAIAAASSIIAISSGSLIRLATCIAASPSASATEGINSWSAWTRT